MDTNNDMIKILEIYPSDILAESMRKINWNFNAIIGKNNATDFKLLALAQSLKDRIDALERGGASRDNDIARNLDALNEKFNGLDTSEDIKNAIDEALANANLDIQNFIITHVEDTVSHKYGDYVTTSYYERDKSALESSINGKINDVNREVIRISSAFDEWTADAVTGTASASRIVANATFYKNEDGYLVYINPTDDNIDPPAPYKTLEDWYNGESSVRNEVDPDGKGLDDDFVAQRLIQKAKLTFRTIYKEMSQIKQWVSENAAGFDILASVNSKKGPITAAILGYANEHKGESGIVMNADVLNLDANHKLRLKSNTFTIESSNFSVDENGDVTSNNMTANNMTANNMVSNNMTANSININGLTLNSVGAKTYIGSDGILHANGAVISGDITTNSLTAQSSRNVDVSGYSGTITRNTRIDGSQFKIESEGVLRNGSNTKDVTGNSLYIEIVDEFNNEENSVLPSGKLYGVPMLCMRYGGETYRLSPGAWLKAVSSSSDGDSSNMSFMSRGSVQHMKINDLNSTASNYYYSGNHNASNITTYYFFRAEDNGHTNNSPSAAGYRFIDWSGGISNGTTDNLYQFEVKDWGGTAGTSPTGVTRAQLMNTYGLISSTTGDVGSYVLESNLGSAGRDYCGDGGQIRITTQKCTEMARYVQGPEYITNESNTISVFTDSAIYTTSSQFESAAKCGSLKIMQLMKDLLMERGIEPAFKSNIWRTQYVPSGMSYGSYSNVSLTRDASGKFPFDGTGSYNGTNRFSMSYRYWPANEIVKTSRYTTYKTTANRVLVEVNVTATRQYDSNFDSRMTCEGFTTGTVTFKATNVSMNFKFRLVLNLNSDLSSSTIKEKIEQFFTDFNFNNVKTSHDSDYYNYFYLGCNIVGDVVNDNNFPTGNTIELELIDNYS